MSQTRRLDAWQHAESRKQRIRESQLLFRFLVFFFRQSEAKDGGVFGHKAWVDVGEPHETAGEQSGTAEKNKRKRDLEHNQRSAQTTARIS